MEGLRNINSQPLPIHDAAVLDHNLADVSVPLAFYDPPDNVATGTGVACPHGLSDFLADTAQVSSKHSWADGPDLDVVLFQLVVPVEHEHVQRNFTTSVGNGLKVDRLGPSGGQWWCGEIRSGGLVDGG